MDFEAYARSLPATFEEFWEYASSKPPFDLPNNPMGFPPGEPPRRSCQSALMPVMHFLARKCETIVELGCREGYSTVAFARGLSFNNKPRKRLFSFDIKEQAVVSSLKGYVFPCEWSHTVQNTADDSKQIPECDMLFVDTQHVYDHVKKELELHGHKARTYLLFHDTVSQGVYSLDCGGREGINRAIAEYANAADWEITLHLPYNHGLTLLERK